MVVAKRQINVATGRRLKAKRQSLMKVKRGHHRKAKRHVEAQAHVISPRGRELEKGVVRPSEQPPEGMPQSAQDYFLSSRAIRRMAYDDTRNILEIIFQNGYGYHFYSVPVSVWENMKAAQSKGKFFMDQIYGVWVGPKGNMKYFPNFTYRRIQ